MAKNEKPLAVGTGGVRWSFDRGPDLLPGRNTSASARLPDIDEHDMPARRAAEPPLPVFGSR